MLRPLDINMENEDTNFYVRITCNEKKMARLHESLHVKYLGLGTQWLWLNEKRDQETVLSFDSILWLKYMHTYVLIYIEKYIKGYKLYKGEKLNHSIFNLRNKTEECAWWFCQKLWKARQIYRAVLMAFTLKKIWGENQLTLLEHLLFIKMLSSKSSKLGVAK